MIITQDELITYAPSLVDNPNFTNLILLTQSLIESSKGCNRSLEITDYQEIKKINKFNRNVFLSYFPFLEPITVEVRYNSSVTRFGRKISVSDWKLLPESAYVLDANGTINFSNLLSNSLGNIPDEARLSYQAGFDFTDTENPEIIKLKSLFGSVLEYTQSNSFKGVKKLDIDGEVSIEYSGNSNNNSSFEIPESLLLLFKKYSPRYLGGGTR